MESECLVELIDMEIDIVYFMYLVFNEEEF